jgi:heptosyltransferase-3
VSVASKRLERRLKRSIFGLLARRRRTTPGAAVDLSTVSKVLFVRANFRMGNLLLVTPALAAARQALPHARLDVLCSGASSVLLRPHPDVDRVLCLRRAMLGRPWELAAIVRRIRQERYDLVIECGRGASFFGALFAGLSGGRYRVAAANSRYGAFFNVQVPRPGGHLHKIDILLRLLEGIGIPTVTHQMKVVPTGAEQQQAAAQWRAWGIPSDRAVVGVVVAARHGKRLPTSQVVETVRRLETSGARVIVFVGPEDRDSVTSLRASMPEGAIVAEPVALRRFAALLARCAVVVTPDSGPMHLAIALGVPTVAVLQSVESLWFRPLGDRHRALYDESGVPPALIAETACSLLEGSTLPAHDQSRAGFIATG